jgi:hypothetical protein
VLRQEGQHSIQHFRIEGGSSSVVEVSVHVTNAWLLVLGAWVVLLFTKHE